MQLRRIKIANFRGIRSLDWTCSEAMICLVGHGDSTKTTVLDAIDLALSTRYGQAITDTDFFMLDTTQPIRIEVTIGQLPDSVLSQDKFGLLLRGWDMATGALNDEPGDDLEDVLTIALDIDDSMEPWWHVITDRDPEGRDVQPRDRDLFGVARIGAEIDRHLTWSRGSALMKATAGIDGVKRVLAEAHQKTRDVIDRATLDELRAAAEKAETAAVKMGVVVRDQFRPSLSALPSYSGQGFLALHDGKPPLQGSGLATRRLVAFGLQAGAIPEGGIVLIDEVENGLEPHRLRHLLDVLRPSENRGQVIFSSHSPVTLLELDARELQLVRSRDGVTEIRRVPDELQDLLRAMPEAFLTHRVLVGEGRTEVGFCRGMEALWREQCGAPLPHVGAIVVDGGGDGKTKLYAEKLSTLAFAAGILVDSDNPSLDVSESWSAAVGVRVFSWDGGCCLETRIATDLPWSAVRQMAALAIESCGSDSFRAHVGQQLPPGSQPVASDDPEDWKAAGLSEAEIRVALGVASNKRAWFKTIEFGAALGNIVAQSWAEVEGKPLGCTLGQIRDWLYARAESSATAQ